MKPTTGNGSIIPVWPVLECVSVTGRRLGATGWWAAYLEGTDDPLTIRPVAGSDDPSPDVIGWDGYASAPWVT